MNAGSPVGLLRRTGSLVVEREPVDQVALLVAEDLAAADRHRDILFSVYAIGDRRRVEIGRAHV